MDRSMNLMEIADFFLNVIYKAVMVYEVVNYLLVYFISRWKNYDTYYKTRKPCDNNSSYFDAHTVKREIIQICYFLFIHIIDQKDYPANIYQTDYNLNYHDGTESVMNRTSFFDKFYKIRNFVFAPLTRVFESRVVFHIKRVGIILMYFCFI